MHWLAKSRATATRAVAWSAGGFVLILLGTAPFRDEPRVVVLSYWGLLGVFSVGLKIRERHPTWAGALVCLGPFALITGLVAARGGVSNPSAVLAYMTLVILAALCWGSRGAFALGALGSLAVGCFAALGPRLAGMGRLQTWAEISFQLGVVAFVSDVLLRTVDRAATQALRLEAEEHKAHLARLALEARVLESRSLEAVGRLAGGVAHDFNNLLTVILGGTERLREGSASRPSDREDLLRIEDAALRASKLTGQLLAVGRKQVLSPIVLCPAETARGLEPLLRRLLPATTELSLELAPDTGNSRVDESRLEQIFLNLVTNASDAVQGGGTVTLITKNTLIGEEEASGSDLPPGNYVEIAVSDTGAGMSAEVRDRIFEPFFTTKHAALGTGLGLATVLGIVQQSGGVVRVESEIGQGSKFRVLLPRTPSQPETPRSRPRPAHSEITAHILLVEDESAVRSATRRLLESLGHTVTDVESGAEALALCAENGAAFEILVSDVIMPGITGPALAEQLWKTRPSLRVLFVSGYPADQIPLSGGLPSQSKYLPKPFRRADLGAKLAEMLSATKDP